MATRTSGDAEATGDADKMSKRPVEGGDRKRTSQVGTEVKASAAGSLDHCVLKTRRERRERKEGIRAGQQRPVGHRRKGDNRGVVTALLAHTITPHGTGGTTDATRRLFHNGT